MKKLTKDKSQKNFKVFRLSFIVAGFIFLSNPLVGLIDILPDFIGYFFLIVGLDGIKRLNGDIEYGVKKLKYLCGISAVFFVLMFNIFKMDSSWDLTLTFSYMALNILVGLGACKDIFVGLDYCTDRHGSENFPSASEPKIMTSVYIWCKSLLVIAPKLYALVEVSAAGELSPETDYNSILSTEKYVVAVSLFLSLVIGIAWLRYVIKYSIAFKNDKVLNEKLLALYISDYSKDGVPINFFNISFGSGLILVSLVFIYDFVLDTVHFFPEFLSIIISVLGLYVIRKYVEIKSIWKYALPPLAFQILIYIYRYNFIENVIFETWDITVSHLIISSLLALGYIVFTFLYFSRVHEITSESYEVMFGKKLIEIYEWGDIFYLIAIICGGANIICPVWRPYFVAVMIVSLFAAIYHYSKIYTKFDMGK